MGKLLKYPQRPTPPKRKLLPTKVNTWDKPVVGKSAPPIVGTSSLVSNEAKVQHEVPARLRKAVPLLPLPKVSENRQMIGAKAPAKWPAPIRRRARTQRLGGHQGGIWEEGRR